jgi:hypothetical protein
MYLPCLKRPAHSFLCTILFFIFSSSDQLRTQLSLFSFFMFSYPSFLEKHHHCCCYCHPRTNSNSFRFHCFCSTEKSGGKKKWKWKFNITMMILCVLAMYYKKGWCVGRWCWLIHSFVRVLKSERKIFILALAIPHLFMAKAFPIFVVSCHSYVCALVNLSVSVCVSASEKIFCAGQQRYFT